MSDSTTTPEGRRCPECGTLFTSIAHRFGACGNTPAPEGGEDDTVLCPKCGQEAMYVLAPDERRGQYVCDSPHCEGGYFTHVAPTLAATGGEEGRVRSPRIGVEAHNGGGHDGQGEQSVSELLPGDAGVSAGAPVSEVRAKGGAAGGVVGPGGGDAGSVSPLRRDEDDDQDTLTLQWQAAEIAALRHQLAEAEHRAMCQTEMHVAAADLATRAAERATTAERRLEEVGQYLSVREREGVLPAIMEVTTKLAAFREALTFYGTVANWHTTSRGFAAQYDPVPSPINADFGAKAREALSSLSSPHQSTGQGA